MNLTFQLSPSELAALHNAVKKRDAPFSEAESKLAVLGFIKMTPGRVSITRAGQLRIQMERAADRSAVSFSVGDEDDEVLRGEAESLTRLFAFAVVLEHSAV